MKCPFCETVFEAIKKLLAREDDHFSYDNILKPRSYSNNWTQSSFVDHLKRCHDNRVVALSGNITTSINTLNKLTPERNYLLNSLVSTSEQNFGRKKQRFRHNDSMKMFAAYIKMIGGRLLYETLHANLPFSLLSPSRVSEYLSEKGPTINEGTLRSNELKEYLTKRNLPMKVWVSENGTRMTLKAIYDPKSNQLVGFNSPLNKDGMPIKNLYMARTAKEIESHFLSETNTISSTAYTVMANPLSEKEPPFCLSIFGTNNKFNFQDVLNRWSYIKIQLKENGITNYGNSSGGDTRRLKAMKIASQIGQESVDFNCKWYRSGEMAWFQSKNENISTSIYTSIYVQDTTHIATKFRNAILKSTKIYPMGKAIVSNGHLKYLINNVPKDQHLLNFSDVQPRDRQNFSSAEKNLFNQHSKLFEEICSGK